MDQEKLIAASRMILEAVGEDPDREGLARTPERMARMYMEVFQGLTQDPEQALNTVFHEDYDEIVVVRDISFCSMCVSASQGWTPSSTKRRAISTTVS